MMERKETMGYSMVQIGNFYLLIALSYIVMTYVCKKIISFSNTNKLMLIGLFISLTGIVLMAALNIMGFHNATAIMVPAAIMAAGYGFSGFYWWEVDLAYYILKLLSLVGIIWDMRSVPAKILKEGYFIKGK